MGNETLCYFVVLFDGDLFRHQNLDMRLVEQTKAHFFQRTSFPRSMRCKRQSILYSARSYSQGSMRLDLGGTTGIIPKSRTSWRVSLPS